MSVVRFSVFIIHMLGYWPVKNNTLYHYWINYTVSLSFFLFLPFLPPPSFLQSIPYFFLLFLTTDNQKILIEWIFRLSNFSIWVMFILEIFLVFGEKPIHVVTDKLSLEYFSCSPWFPDLSSQWILIKATHPTDRVLLQRKQHQKWTF